MLPLKGEPVFMNLFVKTNGHIEMGYVFSVHIFLSLEYMPAF